MLIIEQMTQNFAEWERKPKHKSIALQSLRAPISMDMHKSLDL